MKSKSEVTVKVKFVVEVDLGRIDAQPMQEFLQDDVEDMKPYLMRLITKAIKERRKFNAIVESSRIKNVTK